MQRASLQGRHPHITGIWAWCKKIEMIHMHLFDGWQSLCQILPPVLCCQQGRGIPNVVVWWMLDPPSDPPSRSHLLNVNPVNLGLWLGWRRWLIRAPSYWMAGNSSGHGARWPQIWLRGSKNTSHTPGLLVVHQPQMIDYHSPFCPLFPHHRQWVTPLKWWHASRWWIWLNPWPLGTLKGTLDGRTSTPLAGFRA